MVEITFTIYSPKGSQEVSLTRDRLTIGRSETADIAIDDPGLSSIHCSIHREDDNIWILDESADNGTYVNGKPVSALGTPLGNQDEISLGQYTTVLVRVIHPNSYAPIKQQSKKLFAAPPLPLLVSLIVLLVALI